MPKYLDEPLYRYITVKQRESIPLEDYAWPDAPDRPEYPIDTQEHLDSAATLIGHAPDDKQASIKAHAIKIAKRKGFTLPTSWQEDDKPMNKADEADILRATMPTEMQIYMPILRIDREKREVVVRVTSEATDSYNTRFKYDASKEAFAAWRGNIREMHQPLAVGRALQIDTHDDEKAIDVTLRVSKGAEDTWQKVLDGTLSGASVGARNGKWGKEVIDGEEIPVLERYELAEVSLVDNPSNPDCNISIIRADGVATEVLDDEADPEPIQAEAESEPEVEAEAEAEAERVETPEIERRGAKHSVETMAAMHTARDHALQSAAGMAQTCNCPDCQALSQALDPDQDGDIDIVPSLDTDDDGGATGDGSGDGQSRVDIGEIVRQVTAETTRINNEQINHALKPLISRLSGIAANLSQIHTTHETPDTTRRLEAVDSKIDAELAKVHTALAEVKSLAVAIANQPQTGGPVVNSALLRQQQSMPEQGNPLEQEQLIIERLSRAGVLNKDQQINAALYLQKQAQGR